MRENSHRHFDLAKVGDRAWRVSDALIAEEHPSRVVAFIECHDEQVEVVWVRGSTSGPRVFPALDQALNAVSEVIAADPPPVSRRPIPIAHFPPRVSRAG